MRTDISRDKELNRRLVEEEERHTVPKGSANDLLTP